MACSNVDLVFINGYSNTETLVVGEKKNGVVSEFDFTATTRIVLELYDTADVLADTIDSDTSPLAIDWSANPTMGEVVLALGIEGIVAGLYSVRLIQYSPTKPSGEIIDRGDIYTFDIEVKDV